MSVFKENSRLVNHLHSDRRKESWTANIGDIMLMKRSFPVAEQLTCNDNHNHIPIIEKVQLII